MLWSTVPILAHLFPSNWNNWIHLIDPDIVVDRRIHTLAVRNRQCCIWIHLADNRIDVRLQRRPSNRLCHRIPMSGECNCVAANNRIHCFCRYFQDNWTRRLDWHNFVFRHIVESMASTDPSYCRQSHRICIANFCTSLRFRRCHRCNGLHCRRPTIALNRSHRCIENVRDIRASHNRPRLIDPNIELLHHNARSDWCMWNRLLSMCHFGTQTDRLYKGSNWNCFVRMVQPDFPLHSSSFCWFGFYPRATTFQMNRLNSNETPL